MATELKSPVHRQVEVSRQWFRSGIVIMTVHPSGFIGFREKNKRSQFKLNLNEAARLAVVQSVNKIRAKEKELRTAGQRKGARRKATQEVLQNITK